MPKRQCAHLKALVVLISASILVVCLGATSNGQAVGECQEAWSWEQDVEFPGITLSSEDGTLKIGMGDLPTLSGPGQPSLPYQSLMIPVPQGYDVSSLEVELLSPKTLGPFETISWAQEQAPISSFIDGEAPLQVPPSPQRLFPGVDFVLLGTHVLHGSSFAIVNMYPVAYDSVAKSLTCNAGAHLSMEAHPSTESEGTISSDGRVDGMDRTGLNEFKIESQYLVEGNGAEYVIITSAALESQFQPLLDWKAGRGSYSRDLRNLTVEMVTVENIISNPDYWKGPSNPLERQNDTQSQIRNFIIDSHQSKGTMYFLLGGDEEIIPSRKVRVVSSLTSSIPADAYYAGLDGSWDLDGDGIYGEGAAQGGGLEGEEADLLLEVNIGRATVDSTTEASNFVNKVIAYEKSLADPYLNTTLLVGEKLDSLPTWGANYKEEIRTLTFPEGNPDLDVQTLYDKEGTFSSEAFLSAMNNGVHIINHIGHGDYDTFAELEISDVTSLYNDQYFVLFSQACFIGGFDNPDGPDTITEELLCSEHGAFAVLANSRQGWYSPGDTDGSSQQYDKEFFDAIFNENIRGLGPALNDAKMDLVSSVESTGSMRWCFMTLNLLGDPETQLSFNVEREHDVSVLSFEFEEAFVGEACQVDATVGNLGEYDEVDVSVDLMVDGEIVNHDSVDVMVNGTAEAHLTWIPEESGIHHISVRTNLSDDIWNVNDILADEVDVATRISGFEVIADQVLEMQGRLLVEINATLRLENATLVLGNSLLEGPPLLVMGGLEILNSSLEVVGAWDAGAICEAQSSLLISCSALSGEQVDSLVNSSGEVSVSNSTFLGAGLKISGGNPSIRNTNFSLCNSALDLTEANVQLENLTIDSSVNGITLSSSGGSIESCSIHSGGTGVVLIECQNITLIGSSISDCNEGLLIESSKGLRLFNSTILGNSKDLWLSGVQVSHFIHYVEGIQLTNGEFLYLLEETGFEINSSTPIGYLALVSCHSGTVAGLELSGNYDGLLLVNSSQMEITGCRFHDNAVGIRMLDSWGCSVWGNDFISNLQDIVGGEGNRFNGTYEQGGNYWDSYQGVDLLSGPEQNWPNGDGIGDTPYSIPGTTSVDHYPLISPATLPHSPPVANFGFSPSSPLTEQLVTFTDLSNDPDGRIVNWTWDLGDGVVEYVREPAHIYGEDGNFTVTLWVMDDTRQWDSHSEVLSIQNRAPSVEFTFAPSFPEVGEEVSFSDHSSDTDGHIAAWSWDFGDGDGSTLQNPSHTYMIKEDYSVTLTVWDDDGKQASVSKMIVVGNIAPVADLSISNPSPLTGEEVLLKDMSTDQDGTIVQWLWDLGDGHYSEMQNPTHSYADDGTYHVTLTVVDDSGESDSSSAIINVRNRAPIAAFLVFPSIPSSGDEVRFQDLSDDPDGEVTAWYWDFGDEAESDGSDPVHVFEDAGTYTVTLIVWDDDGELNESAMDIVVVNSPPVADFAFSPKTVFSLTQVSFQDRSWDLDGEIVNWTWNFGDGTWSHLESPGHAYDRSGDYQVSLVVQDDEGATSTKTVNVQVMNLAPVADFSWSFDPDNPLMVLFNSSSYDPDGGLPSHHWNFGDGTVSTEINPVHSFGGEGNLTISLIVIDDDGNSSLIQKGIVLRVCDLVIDQVLLDTEGKPVIGENLSLIVSVRNTGSLGVDGIRLTLMVDGLVVNEQILSLEGNSSISLTLHWNCVAGNHTFLFELDPENEIVEMSEDNNIHLLELAIDPQTGTGGEDIVTDWIPILVMGLIVVVILLFAMRLRSSR